MSNNFREILEDNTWALMGMLDECPSPIMKAHINMRNLGISRALSQFRSLVESKRRKNKDYAGATKQEKGIYEVFDGAYDKAIDDILKLME